MVPQFRIFLSGDDRHLVIMWSGCNYGFDLSLEVQEEMEANLCSISENIYMRLLGFVVKTRTVSVIITSLCSNPPES